MTVGENIKLMREDKEWTQQELADAVGVSRSMIARIERADRSPTVNLTSEIANKLGCNIVDLISKKE